MDFSHDEEQLALRDAVRGLLGKAYGDFEDRRRAVREDPGFDESVWGRLAEMGVLGLPFAEDDGGMGAGPAEVGIVAEEMGRVIAPEPFLTSVVLAGGLVSAAGSAAQRGEVLGALSAGESVLAFAHDEPGSRWQPHARDVHASRAGDGWTLRGTKEPVPHGARADLLVVSAVLPDDAGTGLFLVRGEDCTRTGYPAYDGSRVARVQLTEAAATPLGDGGDASEVIEAVTDAARIAASSEALGAMEVALSTTRDYLTSRRQFGVTLNTFQALTFRAADMYVSLELARSITQWATMVLAEDGPDEAAEAAARASLFVSRAARHIGKEAIQLHGGIGMTAEYAIGSYTARLTALDHLFGDGDHHLARLATRVGDYAEVDPLE
jgi:alkylation response protein AidB-like acyl-CoA dehydrogenase